MDPITSSILLSLATNYFTTFTAPAVQKFFEQAFQLRPELEVELQSARTSRDFEDVFKKATGVIDAAVGTGSIAVNKTFLQAMHGIRFNHQDGTVSIAGCVLKAPVLETGGTGVGTTTIGGQTSMQSQGTRIDVGLGASITISGNASIRQN